MELEELVQSVDIVEYISQFVDLEERNGEFWGLSPFKEEKTPSFSVKRDPPFFYDFSSGIGGNLIEFIKAFNHCSSGDAVKIIEKYAGKEIDELGNSNKLSATSVMKRFKPQSQTRKENISRPLPDNYMNKYDKGYKNLEIWMDEGISRESLDRFCVRYDPFSDRIVYPIRNIDGKIVNVGGRTLDPLWKEKGLRKYCYFFQWGSMNTIYGLFENMEYIKSRGEVILFEGCKSVLIADSWGMKNTGAILTSHLNFNQLKILAKLGCRVVFALDNDVDITRDKNIEKLNRYVGVEYLKDTEHLLNQKDSPVDEGPDVFKKLYSERRKYR